MTSKISSVIVSVQQWLDRYYLYQLEWRRRREDLQPEREPSNDASEIVRRKAGTS